ncbi:MAG: chromosomal replication initiator protein DnaA [Microbacteriaceae bacterium]|nr:chromosomal replication initiator protein DnaA [Microbacteriaceae bacterium]
MAQEDESTARIWHAIRSSLEKDDQITNYQKGFLDLIQPAGISAGTIILEVPNAVTERIINTQLRIPLVAALSEAGENLELTNYAIAVNPDLDVLPQVDPVKVAEPPTNFTTPTVEMTPTGTIVTGGSNLNSKYTFDNFVIGQSNRFAHAAALAVAEAPARSYNPLFIYGQSGLGKTHLLHAIGHYALANTPGIKVRYVSSEEFTNDFINSIASNQMSTFNSRYRDVDILLIDDIQFLQNRDSTQDSFFHTFNTLHDHHKQVVITSDVPPKKLQGFEERMRSRFEWGLITDVQAPDIETRIAILRRKAELEHLSIDVHVLEYIATKISSNIRELEGTLIRVSAFASLNRKPIDLDLVQIVLKDVIALHDDQVISPSEIITAVSEYFNIDTEDIYGAGRTQEVATARQIAMYLVRNLTDLAYPKIGKLFGGRDHTTVMYANNKIIDLMSERRVIYNQVTELEQKIKQRYT